MTRLRAVAAFPVLSCFLIARFGFRTLNFSALDRVIVCPKHALAYNRVKKNANTSMVILLRELQTGMVEDRKAAKRNSMSLLQLPFSEYRRFREITFFVVIRNPYTRVLSAFLDKFRMRRFTEKFGAFELTPPGFRRFVFWLKEGGLDKNSHWDLQTKLMLLPLQYYDHVICLENLKSGMARLLESKKLSGFAERLDGLYPSDLGKKTSANEKIEAFYDDGIKNLVYEMYKADFLKLGYSSAFGQALLPRS